MYSNQMTSVNNRNYLDQNYHNYSNSNNNPDMNNNYNTLGGKYIFWIFLNFKVLFERPKY